MSAARDVKRLSAANERVRTLAALRLGTVNAAERLQPPRTLTLLCGGDVSVSHAPAARAPVRSFYRNREVCGASCAGAACPSCSACAFLQPGQRCGADVARRAWAHTVVTRRWFYLLVVVAPPAASPPQARGAAAQIRPGHPIAQAAPS